MITLKKGSSRGHADHGWLDTYHTFSFADYYDRNNMHFRALRVINEDRVDAAQGFGAHAHNDMEIITYVLEGALEHKDSMGNVGIIRPGEVQRMSAGTGVRHSEYNHSKTEPVHLLQIWIMPERRGIEPSYEEARFSEESRRDSLKLVAARQPEDGAVLIHQDVRLYASLLAAGKRVEHTLESGRAAWLQLAKGSVRVNGELLEAGDAISAEDEQALRIEGVAADSEFLLFDLGPFA